MAARIADGGVTVIESLGTVDGKTKGLVTGLGALGLEPVPTLLVLQRMTEPVSRAARNVPWLTVEAPSHVSVYQLLRARQVVFEREALRALEEALSES